MNLNWNRIKLLVYKKKSHRIISGFLLLMLLMIFLILIFAFRRNKLMRSNSYFLGFANSGGHTTNSIVSSSLIGSISPYPIYGSIIKANPDNGLISEESTSDNIDESKNCDSNNLEERKIPINLKTSSEIKIRNPAFSSVIDNDLTSRNEISDNENNNTALRFAQEIIIDENSYRNYVPKNISKVFIGEESLNITDSGGFITGSKLNPANFDQSLKKELEFSGPKISIKSKNSSEANGRRNLESNLPSDSGDDGNDKAFPAAFDTNNISKIESDPNDGISSLGSSNFATEKENAESAIKSNEFGLKPQSQSFSNNSNSCELEFIKHEYLTIQKKTNLDESFDKKKSSKDCKYGNDIFEILEILKQSDQNLSIEEMNIESPLEIDDASEKITANCEASELVQNLGKSKRRDIEEKEGIFSLDLLSNDSEDEECEDEEDEDEDYETKFVFTIALS